MTNKDQLQQQLIRDLLVESADGLDRFDREVMALEEGRGTAETPNVIFRVIHTIKGTAGCLGLTKIEAVAHVGENLLSALRDGQVRVHAGLVNALLTYADALREMLHALEETGTEGDADYADLLRQLRELHEGGASTEVVPALLPGPAAGSAIEAAVSAGWGLFEDDSTADEGREAGTGPTAESPPASGVASATGRGSGPGPGPGPRNVAGAGGGRTTAQSAIRVSVEQLDKLMNLVGELVLARNQIVQHCAVVQDGGLTAASQRLNLITTELQEGVMKTRMQPIGNVWSRFPRIVRDVAQELGKQVRLTMEGDKTELDRTIIEAIKDPLTHLIRNAIDHGVELPAARQEAGKPEEGRITLRAFHEGGQVNIEILDDGRGINVARVKQKAVEKGAVTPEQAARMGDREAFNLIFLPGLSTAEAVTNVSGRGVGMDVVKANIEKIGGSVDVLSEAGLGTTIKIKIPLTLAIIPALVVTTGGARFAIPQVSLVELVRLEGDAARRRIEVLYGAPVYRLRGQLLPLCYLDRELGLHPRPTSGSAAGARSASGDDADVVNIVVLQADGRQFGLVVDEINDTEEIVVKPLSKQLKGILCFAGATIMGDGRVALILDVLGLAQHANVVGELRDRALAERSRSDAQARSRQSLLLFDAARGSRMAIPLSVVSRLEEFPRGAVERSGTQEVVQYRGQILPLIRVADHVPGSASESLAQEDPMQVVVYSEQGRSVGLVVGRINDIVEQAVTVKRDAASAGILGSAVIQEKVTDLLDVPAVIRSADPTFYRESGGVVVGG